MSSTAFQDRIPYNSCYGCGPKNPEGLRIKSHWDETGAAVCSFQPQAHHNAGMKAYLNGGIIATLVDCHCVCAAIDDGYRRENRESGTDPLIWYVTGQLSVSYKKPARIDLPVNLSARIVKTDGKKTYIECSVESGGEECAVGEVTAIRVPPDWGRSA